MNAPTIFIGKTETIPFKFKQNDVYVTLDDRELAFVLYDVKGVEVFEKVDQVGDHTGTETAFVIPSALTSLITAPGEYKFRFKIKRKSGEIILSDDRTRLYSVNVEL